MESDSSKRGGGDETARQRAMETIAPGTGSSGVYRELPPAPEIRIAGYASGRELGRGGQAVVYLALQQSTGRKVAIKVMRKQALEDERALARFKREVQVLAALDHPNIVGIVDTGTASDGSQFIVMSYVAGTALDEYVKQQAQEANNPGKVLRLFLKICGAVNVAHLRGIVHRDLKPSNIRIDERGEPHILDFGLAHTALDHLAGGEGPVSVTGEFLGSLPWCSPEQAEAEPDRIDIRSDVYSLGVILYQILTGGEFPYVVVGNIRDVLDNILRVAPTPPSRHVREGERGRMGSPPINPVMERIVLKALAKNREERYQSAGELGRDIAVYLGGQKAPAAGAKLEEPAKEVAKKGRSKAIAGAVTGAALVAVGVWVWGMVRTPAPQRNQAAAGSAPVTNVVAVGPAANSPANPVAAAAPALPAPPSPAVAAPAPGAASIVNVSAPVPAAPLNGELFMAAGTCHLEGDALALTPGVKGTAALQFGGAGWPDFDMSFEAKLNAGRGFWVETNVGPGSFCQIVVNTLGDNLAVLWHHEREAQRVVPLQHFQLEPDRWYAMSVRVRGQQVRLSIDGREYLSADENQLLSGRVGIGTRNPLVRFREIKVVSPSGVVLWSGPPDLSELAPTDLDSARAATAPSATQP